MAADDVIAAPQMVQGRGRAASKATPGEFLMPVGRIKLGERLRPVTQAKVDDLKVALQEAPLAHPVTIRPVGDDFELVVGAHRLTAFVQMGRTVIPVIIRDLTDLEARQLEIDENLIRSGLNALERLTFVAERVEVWAALNPDKIRMDSSLPVKQRGRPPRLFAKLAKIDGYVPSTMGFVADTAGATDLSHRSVYRAMQTLAGLSEVQRNRLQGTWIADNDAALRQLATIGEAAEQAAVIDALLAGKTKNIAEARAIAAGTPIPPKAAVNTVQRDFEKAWKAATATQRDAMLHWLSGQALPGGWDVTKGERV
ncbi:Chromosome-partitioning protein Spo0J [compost metagenome]